MAAISAFTPYIRPELQSCPVPLIEDTVRSACRMYSQDTWIVRTDLTVTTVASTQSYTLTPPSGHEIMAVKTVVRNASVVLSSSQENSPLRYITTLGAPDAYWFKEGKLWLYPVPDAVYTLSVDAVIRPTVSTTTVDDRYVEYRDPVAFWAKYTLMSMPNVEWFNPERAQMNYAMYSQAVSEIRARDATGRSGSSLRVTPKFF